VHYKAAVRVLKYVRATLDFGLVYAPGGEWKLLGGFSDAEHGGHEDLQPRYGFSIRIGQCCVDCRSKKLVGAATISSGESEYFGGSECARELRYLIKLVTEFENVRPLTKEDEQAMSIPDLKIDNTGTSATFKRRDRSAKIMKSMALREHWIMTEFEQGRLNIDHVRSKLNMSDLHTKCLSRVDLYYQMHLLGMRRCKELCTKRKVHVEVIHHSKVQYISRCHSCFIVDCNTSVEALRILREKSLPQTGEEKWNATNELGSVNLN
jgi:hypothetical protein